MFDDFSPDPQFNSAMGYAALIDAIIRYANGYLVEDDLERYHKTLESWYNETIFLFIQEANEKKSKKITDDDIDKLNKLQLACRQGNAHETSLYLFHQQLNKLTHLAGLRQKFMNSSMPGVLKG